MTDKTPTDAQQYLNVASQCAATATSELAKNVLVDGGSGTLRELLNDAADAIRAGWGQPAQETKGRKVFVCTHCDGVYADQPVTQCDCLPDENTFTEGWICFGAPTQAAESVPAPAPPPECETEAEKRAFAFGWFKALESERRKADSVQDAARYRFLRDGEWRDTDLEPFIRLQLNTLWDAKIDAARKQGEKQ